MGIFGKSDKHLMEENIAARMRYYSEPAGKPAYISRPQTPDEKIIVRTREELELRGYHWNGHQWVRT